MNVEDGKAGDRVYDSREEGRRGVIVGVTPCGFRVHWQDERWRHADPARVGERWIHADLARRVTPARPLKEPPSMPW